MNNKEHMKKKLDRTSIIIWIITVAVLFVSVFLAITGYDNSDDASEPTPETQITMPTEATPTPMPESTPTPPPTPESTPTPTPSPTPTPTPPPTPEPPFFGFIDAHADTISTALPRGHGLYRNTLDVDIVRLQEFPAPVQVFVLWCSDRYVDDAFNWTNTMLDFFEQAVREHSDIIEIALDLDDILRIARQGKISAVLSIEGGEALMGKIENLDHFYNRGVRIFAPTWNRENELGYGQATNSDMGLKPFGIEVVERMDELGIILDVSHLNEAGFWDAVKYSSRPFMASHSNAYSVFAHNRNLKDDMIMAIVERGGIIGYNMYPLITAPNERATMSDVMAHFHHFINLGAGDHIGLGCDFDGIPNKPQGITDVSSLHGFRDLLTEEFDEKMAHKIMEGNFYEFFVRYFNKIS